MPDENEETLLSILKRYKRGDVKIDEAPKDDFKLSKLNIASDNFERIATDINVLLMKPRDLDLVSAKIIKGAKTYGKVRKLAKVFLSPTRLALVTLQGFPAQNKAMNAVPAPAKTLADLLAPAGQLDKELAKVINKEYRKPKGLSDLPNGKITPQTTFSELLVLIESQ